jgi:Family of unknown function (DUF6065)
MKLIAYMIDGHRMDIRPAPIEREWMDNTGERFAYRCLPLNIANAHGWEIFVPRVSARSGMEIRISRRSTSGLTIKTNSRSRSAISATAR